MTNRYRHALTDWIPGQTRVRYTATADALTGAHGTFVGNSDPLPGVTPRSWLGVLIAFDDDNVLDVDPADLVEV